MSNDICLLVMSLCLRLSWLVSAGLCFYVLANVGIALLVLESLICALAYVMSFFNLVTLIVLTEPCFLNLITLASVLITVVYFSSFSCIHSFYFLIAR